MTQPWTQDTLTAWGKETGLKARNLNSKTGVMFSLKGETKTLFTIYTGGLDAGFAAEIAFNKDQPKALDLMRSLKTKHPSATPKTAHKWPRIGLVTFDQSALDAIAYKLKDH